MPDAMRYVEQELLPMLRERKNVQEQKAKRQLEQWAGKRGVCSLMLSLKPEDVSELKQLPIYNMSEIHDDMEKMFISGLRGAVRTAFADGDAVPSIRANVGCGCVNTLIGNLKQTFFPDKMPWLLEHLTADEMNEMNTNDITESKEFQYGMDCMRFMKKELVGTGIEVFPIDIQGPVDLVHLWFGNEFFYLVYDDPDTIHHALSLAVECDRYAFQKCLDIIQPTDHICHYNGLVLPADHPIKISEDTSTLICKEHLEEYMMPYTTRLFHAFGGGYIHYCGSNKHLLPICENFDSSIGLNFGNPERHNLCEVLPVLAENGKSYLDFSQLSDEIIRPAMAQDGSFHVFMSASCRKDEQQEVLERHQKCVEDALKLL